MAKKAAQECYKKVGYSPRDVDVVEVHDCFSCNEVNNLFSWLVFQGRSYCLHHYGRGCGGSCN